MSSKKKDLEIIFNLQWKYGPRVAERSNIVGVYDLPSTTLNWEPFKSYILKNSGTPGDDVKVSYIEDGREFPIESTLDFRTALYAFRKKAMNGEIINLKLERLSSGNKSNRFSPTCDAQTECNYDCKMDRAPDWFITYMAEFKKDILNEVASAITSHVPVLRPSVSHSHYPRKSKTECAKRCRKNHHLDGNEKEVLKTMKLEKKLESKMEKLVNKSKKLKEKKLQLVTKSSDSDAGHSSSKSNSESVSTVDISKMGAAPVRFDETNIPHFAGGELYRHSWKVINNGTSPWTSDTELNFSWGSSLLEPLERVIACPPLKPGEIGSIQALIHIPTVSGRYQMYWHFHHRGRKFGHWLGCELIVDDKILVQQFPNTFLRNIALRIKNTPSSTRNDQEFITPCGSLVDSISASAAEEQSKEDTDASIPIVEEKLKDLHISENAKSSIRKESYEALDKEEIEEVIINKSPSKIQIIEKYFDNIEESSNPRWNFDGKNNSESIQKEINNEEGDEDSHSESISKIDEETSSNSTLNDMVMVNFPEEVEEQPVQGFAFVVIDGVKTAVPKKYLRADYLATAEDAPDPNAISIVMRDCFGIEMTNAQYGGFAPFKFDTDPAEYDDVPDLISSDSIGDPTPDTSLDRNCVPDDEPEKPTRHFIFPERFAGYEIIGNTASTSKEGLVSDAKEVEDTKNTKPDESQQPANVTKVSVPASAPPSTAPPEETMFKPIPYREITAIQSHCFMPRIPNYQQTPPELRTGLYPDIHEYPKEPSQIRYSAKPEIINITTGNGVDPPSQEAKVSPNASSSNFGESDRCRSVPEAAVPISSVVSEAMTMASSALKTVVNKIIPSKNEEHGIWVNGHWVPTAENTLRENHLKTLADMGFQNRDLNASLLARYDDDIRRVVTELVQ